MKVNVTEAEFKHALWLQEVGTLAHQAGVNGPVPKDFYPPWLLDANYVMHNRQMSMYIIDCVFFALAVVMVMMRIYTRVFIIRRFGLDDWLIVLALISVAGFTALQFCFLIYGGVGYHIWDITPEQLQHCFKFIYFHLIGYTWSITLIKMSILFLYERIIPKTHPMRKVLIGFMIFQIVYFFACELTFIFQCNPITGALDFNFRIYQNPKCISLKSMLYSFGIIHIFVDLSLLILPIRVIWELQMPVKRKISTLSLFVIGGVGCICAVMRVVTLAQLLNGFDFTWTIYEPGMWGLLELTIGIICACIPPSKLLFEQIYAKLTGTKFRPFGSTEGDSDYKSDNSSAPFNGKGSRGRSPTPNRFMGSISKSVLMSQTSERIDSIIVARDGPIQSMITTVIESPTNENTSPKSVPMSRSLTGSVRSQDSTNGSQIPRTVVIPPSPIDATAPGFGKIATIDELEDPTKRPSLLADPDAVAIADSPVLGSLEKAFELDLEKGYVEEERPGSGFSKGSLEGKPVSGVDWV
ncbi:hypothetical protein H072_5011 [Dactylellina haptotyla CBS 200.50]|uniref:Rhodopsin domain-containing protein n=1 Tax=Dactylellina haptotyla (strain CBS 200.50) TaxID=1284197 RepID=S8C0J8_DACHA|nr:hypothetical protein H072_5011 [Dactylellina haptotyla CBS 200.50]